MSVVIDTNVAVVANGRHPPASVDCIENCIDALLNARTAGVLVDDGGRIFDEYRRHLSHAGQPGAGDAFFKWLWSNQADSHSCRQIPITPVEADDADFAEFPASEALAGFDRADRKFVAVAVASREDPEILNASDGGWWRHRRGLADCGVRVAFLCPELMRDE